MTVCSSLKVQSMTSTDFFHINVINLYNPFIMFLARATLMEELQANDLRHYGHIYITFEHSHVFASFTMCTSAWTEQLYIRIQDVQRDKSSRTKSSRIFQLRLFSLMKSTYWVYLPRVTLSMPRWLMLLYWQETCRWIQYSLYIDPVIHPVVRHRDEAWAPFGFRPVLYDWIKMSTVCYYYHISVNL